MQKVVHSLSLFTSLGTLICCALPALFVALGAGAVLAGIVSAVPQLIWLSEHKLLVFGVAGLMLMVSGVMRYRSRFAPCPTDAQLAAQCQRLRKHSGIMYVVSLAIYAIGFFFAFVAPLVMG